MTKIARNGIIAILVLVLCACLMLFFAPTALRAKAEENTLADVPFEVEDGVLYTVPGGEGIIATKEAYTIKNDLTVYFKFTIVQESIDFYLGENLDYWVHVTTEGIFPGIWVA
ncbi:MAG: hypothetical protein IIY09_00885, partial [Clostridia bacterium]|nr:hypothetical protein [Clostridia bacterium]